jgi:hypothetical protein
MGKIGSLKLDGKNYGIKAKIMELSNYCIYRKNTLYEKFIFYSYYYQFSFYL